MSELLLGPNLLQSMILSGDGIARENQAVHEQGFSLRPKVSDGNVQPFVQTQLISHF